MLCRYYICTPFFFHPYQHISRMGISCFSNSAESLWCPKTNKAEPECFPRTVLLRKRLRFCYLCFGVVWPGLVVVNFASSMNTRSERPSSHFGDILSPQEFQGTCHHSNECSILFAVRFPDAFGGSSSQLGLERIVLSANGNLQRVMSAYYNRCGKLSPHRPDWALLKKESEYWGAAKR